MSALPTRPLGDSGLEPSVVGLGTNNFGGRLDLEHTRAVVDAAIEQGITFFDTADIYGGQGGSERLLGEILAGRRDKVLLATKFGVQLDSDHPANEGPRGGRAYIFHAVEASLRRLQTDTIDLYWYHLPDGVTPIAETLQALDELVRAGKVRAIGASNLSAQQIEEADAVSREHGYARFVAIQNEYSLLVRDAEREVIPTCERLGIGFVPYYPLASGLLTGKYRRGENAPAGTRLAGRDKIASEQEFDLIDGLERYAQERGVTLLEVAIGALLARPAVCSVIAGATKPEQVRSNAAAGRWSPSAEDMDALEAVLGAAVS